MTLCSICRIAVARDAVFRGRILKSSCGVRSRFVAAYGGGERGYGFFARAQLAFPNDKNPPALRAQCLHGGGVAIGVAGNFCAPIGGVGFRRPRAALAVMTVPEAAMNKDHSFVARQNDVGLAGEVGAMQPEAKSRRVKGAAHLSLRFCIAGFDGAHDRCALFGRKDIVRHGVWRRRGPAREGWQDRSSGGALGGVIANRALPCGRAVVLIVAALQRGLQNMFADPLNNRHADPVAA